MCRRCFTCVLRGRRSKIAFWSSSNRPSTIPPEVLRRVPSLKYDRSEYDEGFLYQAIIISGDWVKE